MRGRSRIHWWKAKILVLKTTKTSLDFKAVNKANTASLLGQMKNWLDHCQFHLKLNGFPFLFLKKVMSLGSFIQAQIKMMLSLIRSWTTISSAEKPNSAKTLNHPCFRFLLESVMIGIFRKRRGAVFFLIEKKREKMWHKKNSLAGFNWLGSHKR